MADIIKKIKIGTTNYSVYDERVKVAEVPANAKFTDTTYTGTQGITVDGTNIKHSNEVTAVGTQGLLKISYDAYGHITGSTAVTKADITALGIPDSDTTYGAEKGISLSGGKFGHSNSISAQDTAVFKKFKYDAQGHITGVANVESSDITPLISGATDDITALQTLVNNIKSELEDPTAAGSLDTVLDTMQAVLNTSANAVTGVTAAAYGTEPYLHVDTDGVLTFHAGTITGGTASGTKSFVTSAAS